MPTNDEDPVVTRMKETKLFDAIVWILVILTLGSVIGLAALGILNLAGVI